MSTDTRVTVHMIGNAHLDPVRLDGLIGSSSVRLFLAPARNAGTGSPAAGWPAPATAARSPCIMHWRSKTRASGASACCSLIPLPQTIRFSLALDETATEAALENDLITCQRPPWMWDDFRGRARLDRFE